MNCGFPERGLMSSSNVYLKCLRSAKIAQQDVFLKDICSLRCADKNISARLRSIKVHRFEKGKPSRHVVSTLRLVELMEETCPQISVEVIGETDVLIEQVTRDQTPGWVQNLKTVGVCLISFLGTAFTIMAYHNDIGINDIFTEMYRLVMNEEPGGLNALEVAYSVGVSMGILIFFNHAGGGLMTKDPTPIQVAMRNYEKDVDNALIENAERESLEEENQK